MGGGIPALVPAPNPLSSSCVDRHPVTKDSPWDGSFKAQTAPRPSFGQYPPPDLPPTGGGFQAER